MVKFKKFIKMGGLLVFLLSLTPLFLGCPSTSGGATCTIVFDESIISADYNAGNGNWPSLKSGDSLTVGTRVDFYAHGLPENDTVDKWTIGEQAPVPPNQNGTDYWFTNVSKAIANSAGVINVSYTTRPAEKYTLEFNSGKISASYWDATNNTEVEILTGKEVKEGLSISFSPNSLESGKVVKAWLIGSTSEFDERWPNVYEIKISDKYADSAKKISVGYLTTDAKDYTLDFDDNIIECTSSNDYNSSTTDNPLAKGATVKEGTYLSFRLKDGVENKTWFVGNQKMWQKGNKCWFCIADYCAIDDGSTKKIVVANRDIANIQITFDPDKVQVEEWGTWNKISSGSTIKEGLSLYIKAKNLNGKVFDNWQIGKQEVANKYLNSKLEHFVITNSMAESGVINIDYTLRDPEDITIEFDANLIEAGYRKDGSWTNLTGNDTVKEGSHIYFEAILTQSDKKLVKDWTIGNTKDYNNSHPNNISIYASKDYVVSNKITISYTLKDAKSYKINFDENKIKAYYYENHTEVNISSGTTEVIEGTEIMLEALHNIDVKEWTIGTRKKWSWKDSSGISRGSFSCVDKYADGNGVINVSYIK